MRHSLSTSTVDDRRRAASASRASDEGGAVVVDDQAVEVAGLDEHLACRVVEELPQRREEAGHVEQADRLVVQADLRPGERLGQLLEGAESARQRDERVGQ